MPDKKISKETIDRYLRNELSASELSDFTFQMVTNPSLRKEVEATRTLFKTLQTTATPTITVTSTNKIKLTTLAIVGIILLAVAAFFFFQKSDTVENITPPAELIFPTEAPTNVPIAQAYIPNEFIETAIGQRDVTTGKRVENFTVAANGNTVDFSGVFVGNIQEAQVTIWNNQKADFIEERFVFAKKIDLQKDGQVNFKIENQLAPGLYYFVVRIDGEMGKVGRFEVK